MKKLARAFQGIKMRKLIIGTIMAVALLGLPAAAEAATAAPLARTPVTDPLHSGSPNGPIMLPATRCAFPVDIAVVTNNEFQDVTTLADGTTVTKITGNLVLSFKNDTTGKTIVKNVSGPTTTTTNPDDSSTFQGGGPNWLTFGPIGQANTGEPGLVFTSGLVTVTSKIVNGLRTAQSFSLNGHQDNGCALLS
jgi:hypothetical protein